MSRYFKKQKFCKFTKGIQYDDPANIFCNESESKNSSIKKYSVFNICLCQIQF